LQTGLNWIKNGAEEKTLKALLGPDRSLKIQLSRYIMYSKEWEKVRKLRKNLGASFCVWKLIGQTHAQQRGNSISSREILAKKKIHFAFFARSVCKKWSKPST
jgi:hypothetical protein